MTNHARNPDAALILAVAARLDPLAFDGRLRWNSVQHKRLHRRLRFRAMREAIILIRMVREC